MDEELPSRCDFYSDRFQWLREKGALDRGRAGEEEGDGVERLWIVNGKLYDLLPYVDKHPGGADFLELTQGMDATAMVESHHLNRELVEQVLAKYYVRDTKGKGKGKKGGGTSSSKAVEDFSFENSGFYRTVQRRARALLGDTRRERGPTREMKAIVWFTLSAWLASFLAMCFGPTTTRVPALAAGFFLYGLLGIGHNGMHTAHPWWKYVMDLSLFSSCEWEISHCLSHHIWPNSQVDFEVSAVEPFIYSLASKAGHKHKVLPFYLWGVLLILGPFELVGRVGNLCKGKQPLRPEHFLPFLQLALAVWGQGSWHTGFRRWLLMHVVASALMGLEAMPLHHSDHSWSDGKPAPRPIDFGRHVVATTQDYAISDLSLLAKVLFAPFHHHRLHHLLPGVDESRLPELEEMLQQTCAEFGVPYNLHNYASLAKGCIRNWLNISYEEANGAGAGAGPSPATQKKKQ